MSGKFVNGRVNIIIDSNGDSSIYEPFGADENYKLLKELNEANVEDNLDKYMQLYLRYINDENIYNYHVFTNQPPCYCTRVFYPKCSCDNKNINSLVKIHKGLYEQSCNCVGGKIYLALRDAYEIEFKKKFNVDECMVCLSILDLFEKFECDIETFEKSNIIKYIESTGSVDFEYTEWIMD